MRHWLLHVYLYSGSMVSLEFVCDSLELNRLINSLDVCINTPCSIRFVELFLEVNGHYTKKCEIRAENFGVAAVRQFLKDHLLECVNG